MFYVTNDFLTQKSGAGAYSIWVKWSHEYEYMQQVVKPDSNHTFWKQHVLCRVDEPAGYVCSTNLELMNHPCTAMHDPTTLAETPCYIPDVSK